MTNWTLLGDRVLIKPDPAETKTKKGILLPNQKAYPQGTLVGIGSKCVEPISLGDKAKYGTNAGVLTVVDGEELLMMRELELFMRRDDKVGNK